MRNFFDNIKEELNNARVNNQRKRENKPLTKLRLDRALNTGEIDKGTYMKLIVKLPETIIEDVEFRPI